MAEAFNYLVERDPLLKKLQLEIEREEVGKGQAEDAKAEAVSKDIEMLAKAALLAAGFHPHKGEWRRGRQAEDQRTEIIIGGLAPMEQVRAIVERANQARVSSNDLEALRRILCEGPELIDNHISLLKRSNARQINRRSRPRIDKKKYKLRVERERVELMSENDGPLEKLLVENVIFCWLRHESIGQDYTSVMENSQPPQVTELWEAELVDAMQNVSFETASPRMLKYWKKRLVSAENRYSKACKMLALVRKLMPQARLKSNIGTGNAFVNDL